MSSHNFGTFKLHCNSIIETSVNLELCGVMEFRKESNNLPGLGHYIISRSLVNNNIFYKPTNDLNPFYQSSVKLPFN